MNNPQPESAANSIARALRRVPPAPRRRINGLWWVAAAFALLALSTFLGGVWL